MYIIKNKIIYYITHYLTKNKHKYKKGKELLFKNI